MKKRALAALVLVFLIASMLCGCSDTGGGSSPGPAGASPSASAAPPAGGGAVETAAPEAFKFPAQTCAYVVGAAAGGGFDVFSRAFTTELGASLGTTFEYMYEDTNSYVMGINDISNVGKGEYAVMCGFSEAMLSAYIYQEANYTIDDISIIGNMYTDAQCLMVRIDESRWDSMTDLIEYGKTASTPINISTPQPLTPANIAAKVFVAASGINANVVEYSGGSGARNDLIGGHVDISIGGLQNAVTLKDQVKVIGVLGPTNSCSDLWDCEVSTDLDFDLPDTSSHCMLWCSKELETEEPEVYNALVERFKEIITSDAVTKNLADVGQERFVDHKDPGEAMAICLSFRDTLEAYRELLDPKLQ